jgi:hypothetical protein
MAMASGELPPGDAKRFLDSTTAWTSVERNSGFSTGLDPD